MRYIDEAKCVLTITEHKLSEIRITIQTMLAINFNNITKLLNELRYHSNSMITERTELNKDLYLYSTIENADQEEGLISSIMRHTSEIKASIYEIDVLINGSFSHPAFLTKNPQAYFVDTKRYSILNQNINAGFEVRNDDVWFNSDTGESYIKKDDGWLRC